MTSLDPDRCSSAMSFLKWFIIIINALTLLVGAASLAAGIWILVTGDTFFKNYDEIADDDINRELLRDGAVILVAVGTTVVLITVLGLVAACTSIVWLLTIYLLVVSILMVLEVTVLVLAVIFKENWNGALDSTVLDSITNQYGGIYMPSRTFTEMFDMFQSEFVCCGWINGTDYTSPNTAPRHWNRESDGVIMKVPPTCCPTTNITVRDECVANPQTSHIYSSQGCKYVLEEFLTTWQNVIIGLAASVLGLEFIVMAATLLMIACIDSNKYDVN